MQSQAKNLIHSVVSVIYELGGLGMSDDETFKKLLQRIERTWEVKKWSYYGRKTKKESGGTDPGADDESEEEIYEKFDCFNPLQLFTLRIKSLFRNSYKQIKRVEELIPGIIVRPAEVNDYVEWLSGYFEKKGAGATVSYHYPMTWVLDVWVVALDDFIMVPLYGEDSVNIIIPSGVQVFGDDFGQCKLYFMDNFFPKYNGKRFIPIYKDIWKILFSE